MNGGAESPGTPSAAHIPARTHGPATPAANRGWTSEGFGKRAHSSGIGPRRVPGTLGAMPWENFASDRSLMYASICSQVRHRSVSSCRRRRWEAVRSNVLDLGMGLLKLGDESFPFLFRELAVRYVRQQVECRRSAFQRRGGGQEKPR
jgi:hypothetical protein